MLGIPFLLKYLPWFVFLIAALVNEEDTGLYGNKSPPADDCCSEGLVEPSSDSLHLPTKNAHDIFKGNNDRGKFSLYIKSIIIIIILGVFGTLFSQV